MFRKCVAIVLALACTSLVAANDLENALELNDHGFVHLEPVLHKEELLRLYSQDRSDIVDFPFSNYQVVDIPAQGKFYIDNRYDWIKNFLKNGHVWEWNIKQIIETHVKPGTVALDIGAHIGTHTITMSKCVGAQGKVFAFEPSKKIYRELVMNLALNQCENVMPLRCALGKEHGVVQVETPNLANEGGSYVIKEAGGLNTAAMICLDDLKLPNVSFIKIDVENMEADVLDGAKQTIEQCRPIMVIEIQGNLERPRLLGEDSRKMAHESLSKIQGLGYHLESLGGADYLALPVKQ